jgi:phosphorylcholine metabolism protein LicD
MTPKEKIQVLIEEIKPTLGLLQDDHFIIGASALIISGVDIADTQDIDLVTSLRDAKTLKSIWNRQIRSGYKPEHADKFRSHFTRYQFATMDVEVMGALEMKAGREWLLLKVHASDAYAGSERLRIPTLQEQRRILLQFGREKDLQKVAFMDA